MSLGTNLQPGKQQQSQQNVQQQQVINPGKVVLEGGGEFEEGQTYIIRDRQGNSQMRIWKEGKFYPVATDRLENGMHLDIFRITLFHFCLSRRENICHLLKL